MMSNPNGLTAEVSCMRSSSRAPMTIDEWVEHLSEVYFATFQQEPEGNDLIYIENIARNFEAEGMTLADPSKTKLIRGSADLGFRVIN
jgi:hypothetical protein